MCDADARTVNRRQVFRPDRRRVVPLVAYFSDGPQAARPGSMSSAPKIPLRSWPV